MDNQPENINDRNINESVTERKPAGRKGLVWLIAAAAVMIIAGVIFGISAYRNNKALEDAQNEKEQLMLDMEKLQLDRDFDDLNREFAQFENSRSLIMDDSVKRALTEKYETARLQVEALQQELKNQKQKSAAEIAKLKSEIETLRALLRHYVEEINRLNQENEALRNENAQIKDQNARLNDKVVETSRRNEQLSERMTLAEKLNVTGLMFSALNKKGRPEKKIQKARQLMVSFTIPQNNSTPVGEKTIYLRIISPSGQLLGNGGSFTFEDATLRCTSKKIIEYAGEEIGGITIYWDIDTALTPGEYTVELFADNYRLASRSFDVK